MSLRKAIDLTGQWVSVDYTSGFNVDPSDPCMFDLTEVPDWLEAAVRIEVMMRAEDGPIPTGGQGAAFIGHLCFGADLPLNQECPVITATPATRTGIGALIE